MARLAKCFKFVSVKVIIGDISSVWVYSVKYSARWVENVFFPTLNYKYILHQH